MLTKREYDEYLDDVYGVVKIAGLSYLTSRALKDVDPIAYDVGYWDWLGAMTDEEENACSKGA